MASAGVAVHRRIVAVDVEGFGDRRRTNRNQVAVRDGLYGAMGEAFGQAEVPWADCDHEDRGDGIFILVGPEVPKSVFAEALPSALATAQILSCRQPLDFQRRLYYVMARFAGMIGLTLADNTDDRAETQAWFHTARLAADEADDRILRWTGRAA